MKNTAKDTPLSDRARALSDLVVAIVGFWINRAGFTDAKSVIELQCFGREPYGTDNVTAQSNRALVMGQNWGKMWIEELKVSQTCDEARLQNTSSPQFESGWRFLLMYLQLMKVLPYGYGRVLSH